MGTGTRPMTDITKKLDPTTDNQAAELSSAIARTRDEMGGTIEELHGRLNPGVLKDEVLKQFQATKDGIKSELKADFADAKESLSAGIHETTESIKAEVSEAKHHLAQEIKVGFSDAKDAVREATIGKVETMIKNTQETVKETGRTFTNTIKENPVPAALVGVGLVWLFASARSKRGSATQRRGDASFGDSVNDKATGLAGSAGNIAERASSAIGEVTHNAAEAIGTFASGAKTSVGKAAHSASDALTSFGHGAVSQGRRLGHRAEDTFASNPLAVGAAILVVGAAVGLAIPITKKEDRWLGEARDEVMHKAEAFAGDALEKVDGAAKQITADAKKNAEDAAQALEEKREQSQDRGRKLDGYAPPPTG